MRERVGLLAYRLTLFPAPQKLAVDPYGVYAVVVTPTRELAYQIADQFRAFGRPINLRQTVVVGGVGARGWGCLYVVKCGSY